MKIIIIVLIIMLSMGCASYNPYRYQDGSVNVVKELFFITAFGLVSVYTIDTMINNEPQF